MCPLLSPVLIVNRLLFFFFFFYCSHLQSYWSKQGMQYVPLSSLYYLDVYGSHTTKNTASDLLFRAAQKVLLSFPRPRLSYKPSKVRIVPLADWTPSSSIFFTAGKSFSTPVHASSSTQNVRLGLKLFRHHQTRRWSMLHHIFLCDRSSFKIS